MIFNYSDNPYVAHIEVFETPIVEEGLIFHTVRVGFKQGDFLVFKETAVLYSNEENHNFDKWAEETASKLISDVTLQKRKIKPDDDDEQPE